MLLKKYFQSGFRSHSCHCCLASSHPLRLHLIEVKIDPSPESDRFGSAQRFFHLLCFLYPRPLEDSRHTVILGPIKSIQKQNLNDVALSTYVTILCLSNAFCMHANMAPGTRTRYLRCHQISTISTSPLRRHCRVRSAASRIPLVVADYDYLDRARRELQWKCSVYE